MKLRITVEVDHDDRSVPERHEIWRDIARAEVCEFQFPERPFMEGMDPIQFQIAAMDYQRQMKRHEQYVQMISQEIASALGRALGNKGPDR